LGTDNNLRYTVSQGPGRPIRVAKNAYNLRKIQGVTANGVENQILQLVDRDEQILAECSHGDDGGGFCDERAR
jgi:hypothetical protein